MRILRAASRRAVPWKNGGGVTREVCAMPEDAGFDFAWRFSVAEVGASGAFSRFPGIDRKLAVIEGRMRLAIDGQWSAEARPNSPALSFSGEADAFADVIDPVIDANLMTRRNLCRGTLEWMAIDHEVNIIDPRAETILLAVDPIDLAETALRPLDAVWCEPGCVIVLRPVGGQACMLVAKIWLL